MSTTGGGPVRVAARVMVGDAVAVRLIIFVLVNWLLVNPHAALAQATSGSEAKWVERSGSLAVSWDGATSGPILPHGKLAPPATKFTSALLEGRSLILAVWSEPGGKQSAWLGERVTGAKPKPPVLITLWQGTGGAQDVDGEVRQVFELSPAGFLKYQLAAGLQRCDGQPPRLFREMFDLRQRSFAPFPDEVALDHLPELVPHAQPPRVGWADVWPDEPHTGFRFTGASAPAKTRGDARSLSPPFRLSEAESPGWVLPAAQAVGAFATARAPVPAPVTGLVLTALPETVGGLPSDLRVSLGPDNEFRINLRQLPTAPEVWVSFPSPVDSSCLTIQVGSIASAGPVGLARVRVFTALDGSQAGAFLAERLGLARNCDATIRLLKAQTLPFSTIPRALLDRLPSAQSRGQLCLLKALSALPTDDVPDPSAWLAEALPTLLLGVATLESPSERRADLALLGGWLKKAADPCAPALARLAQDESTTAAVRALAAELLVQQEHPAFEAGLLQALVTEAAPNSSAIHNAAARAPGVWVPRISQALLQMDAGKSPERAAKLLALLQRRLQKEPPSDPQSWLPRVRALAQAKEVPFVLRARAVGVLGVVDAPEAKSTILSIAASDPDDVLRFLSLQAVGRHFQRRPQDKQLQAALAHSLRDQDPRVRQTAALMWARAALPVAQQHLGTLVDAFQAERWPFVIPAHVEALAHTCSAETQLVHTLEQARWPQDAQVVALEGLAECKLPSARPQALRLLTDASTAPGLRLTAAQSLAKVILREDAKSLLHTLKRSDGLDDADPYRDDLQVAILQAITLADPGVAVQAAKSLLKQAGLRPREAALGALGTICSADAIAELKRQSEASESSLADTARRSMAKCQGNER